MQRIAMCTEGWYRLFNPGAVGQANLETFKKVAGICAGIGYTGVEVVAPTLDPNPLKMSQTRRRQFQKAAEESGLRIIGLHWLLAMQEGVYLTDPDPAVRNKTIETIVGLVRLAADLGGQVVVHGSPAQRTLLPHVSYEAGFDNAVAIYREVMPRIEYTGVVVCFEQLTQLETDFCTTMPEMHRLVEAVDHPQFCGHLDTKAMAHKHGNDPEKVAKLILQYSAKAGHCHLNDPITMGAPGGSNFDFGPIFQALKASGWQRDRIQASKLRWLSVEPFNFKEVDIEAIAHQSMECIKGFWK